MCTAPLTVVGDSMTRGHLGALGVCSVSGWWWWGMAGGGGGRGAVIDNLTKKGRGT